MRFWPKINTASLTGENDEIFDLGIGNVKIKYGCKTEGDDEHIESESKWVDGEIQAYGVSRGPSYVSFQPVDAAEIRSTGGKIHGLWRNWEIKRFESVCVNNMPPEHRDYWEKLNDGDRISLGMPGDPISYKFKFSIHKE
jgi:hypothetical protein